MEYFELYCISVVSLFIFIKLSKTSTKETQAGITSNLQKYNYNVLYRFTRRNLFNHD